MDAFTLSLWLLRLCFLALVYGFLLLIVRALWRDLRAAVSTAETPLGRLLVLISPEGRPEQGTSIPLDAVTSLGRDVNNTVVVDDDAVSAEHALLTFHGRVWYLQDRDTTNGTLLNGHDVRGTVALGYGDEIGMGGVRLRLERPVPRRAAS